MNYNDIFITNMLFTNINKINTGIIIIDIFLIMFILVIYNNKELIINNDYYNNFIFFFNKINKITFIADKEFQSKNFRAIMFNLAKNKNVTSLTEISKLKWIDDTEEYSFFQVEQKNSFKIENDIYGKIYKKEKTTYGNYKTEIFEFIYFELYSKKKSLHELQKWINIRLQEYENYLLHKNNNKQLYIEIFNNNLNNNPNNNHNNSNNNNNKDLEFNKYEWISSVTFENRFFTNKDKIINNIKFFLENELWYKQRGIPYTLGFLLYGNPGCGKTGFIKALMNLTNFNAISIKLNSHFNFLKLKDIIYKKELNNDIIIPLHKRIFIFEDIDCMTDIIIDRDKEKENKKNKNNNINNNNLSYLLNILDGIHETPGRIIIMTTNKPEVLDKALTRPGRIDHVIHFKNATTDDIKNMINFYWNNTKEEIKINEELNFKYTHAEVINICRKSSDINETISKLSSSHSL